MPANSTKTTTSTETAEMVTTTNNTTEHSRTQYTYVYGIQAIQYRIAMPDAPFSTLVVSVGRGEGEGGGGTPTGAHRQHMYSTACHTGCFTAIVSVLLTPIGACS